MAEYWKSTPKYWCKFCQVYVRDTKLEKQQHESTGRHQGSIQRSLRDIHRGKEREERENQRAKNEVARLNGLVGANPTNPGPSGSGVVAKPSASFTKELPKKATAEDRKRQMAQLAAMGIAIPDEYRKDMALATEWQTVATGPNTRESQTNHSINTDAIVKGVRKRVHDDGEDEEEQARKPRQGWGSQTKAYTTKSADVDFDTLLKEPIKLKPDEVKSDKSDEVKEEDEAEDTPAVTASKSSPKADASLKPEEGTPDAPIVFKKRKKFIKEK